MENILCEISKLLEEVQKNFNESELIIIVKDGKTKVIEKGKPIKYLKRIKFTDAVDEIPEIVIQKGVI